MLDANTAIDLVEQSRAQVGKLARGDRRIGIQAIIMKELSQVQTLEGKQQRETTSNLSTAHSSTCVCVLNGEFKPVLPPRADEPILLGAEVKQRLANGVPQALLILLSYLYECSCGFHHGDRDYVRTDDHDPQT